MASEKVLGIDLGTTNSAVAVMRDGEPEIIPNSEGDRTTPSVVAMSDGELLVGQPAKNQAVQNFENTIQSIKRSMGKRSFAATLGDKELEPEEISAKILQKLKRDAEEYLGEEVERAVITVPAYFDDKQRQATKDAGKIAGFEVERILNEPTAAAMAYGFDQEVGQQQVMVYDLGGGTFDVSILEIDDGFFEVLATNGVNNLGGDDWDKEIIEWAVDEFQKEHGIDLGKDRQALQRLTEAAEDVKKELTVRPETTLSVPFVTADEEGPLNLEFTLKDTKFESMTAHLLEKTVAPTKKAIRDANLSVDDIDEVLLTGGATRMPAVQETVKRITGTKPRKDVNPDEAVALGAAVQAGVLSGETDDMVLVDVTPLSLGVEVKGGLFESVIDRNTRIPTTASKDFTTANDGQTQVEIRVFQGERDIADRNQLLDEFKLTGIPPAEAGVPKIQVKFRIDKNGIVHVTAEDRNSGESENIQIEGGVGLSEDKVREMKRDAKEHAEQDRRRRGYIRSRNQLEQSIDQAERLLENNDDLGVEGELKQVIREAEGLVEAADATVPEDERQVSRRDLQTAHDRFEEILAEVTARTDAETGTVSETPAME